MERIYDRGDCKNVEAERNTAARDVSTLKSRLNAAYDSLALIKGYLDRGSYTVALSLSIMKSGTRVREPEDCVMIPAVPSQCTAMLMACLEAHIAVLETSYLKALGLEA